MYSLQWSPVESKSYYEYELPWLQKCSLFDVFLWCYWLFEKKTIRGGGQKTARGGQKNIFRATREILPNPG